MKPLPDRLKDHASLPPAVALAKWDAICDDMRKAAERVEAIDEAGRCRTCSANPAKMNGECRTCDRYRRRTGKSRPAHLTERQTELNWRRGRIA